MLAFDFCGYEGFKSRFGFMEHGNGTKSRRNKILLSYIKNPSLLREARLTGDFSLLNIQNMTELKNIMFERIMDSGIHTPSLSHKVELINYTFWSSKYQTDKNKGLCEDGDFKSCRYINYDNNGKVFKMKAGRFIRAIIQETSFGQSLPEQVLIYLQECFVQEWQTFTMSTLPKNHLSVNKDFERIYDSSQCNGDFHSCMVNKGLHTFYRDAVDASAAYLQNEEGLKKTSNKLIFIGKQIEIEPQKFIEQLYILRDAAKKNDVDIAIKALHNIVPTFITPDEFNHKNLVTVK